MVLYLYTTWKGHKPVQLQRNSGVRYPFVSCIITRLEKRHITVRIIHAFVLKK